ncbi:hypothetical protein P7L78_10955 [Tistrella bauzanensis]|uniref:AsmA-like C-terminal domain-containing protein n=2 Tax=Tistrella TaxID=171436 RepID=A0ABU9YR45_9PROT|nr:hypothetical protein [Tistrella bauzanensis]GGB23901.1 hypothetical protein GCM10011505_01410 [Tistrella bauzanensis]
MSSAARIAIAAGSLIVIGIAAIAVAGAVWLPGQDLRQVAPSVAQSMADRIANATGEPVSIAGAMQLRLLPGLDLTLNDVRIGADPQTGLAADRMVIGLSVLDLAGGGFTPRRLDLDGPRMALENQGPETAASSGAEALIAAVPSLSIRNGTLDLGLGGDRRVLIDGIEIDATTTGAGVREIRGRLAAGGVPVLVETRLGSADPDGAQAIAGRLTLIAGGALLTYDGQVTDGGFKGRVDMKAGDAGVLAGLVSDVSGVTETPPVPFGLPLRLTGQLSAGAAGARLDDGQLVLGETSAQGAVHWVPGEGTTMRLDVGRLDLAPWIEAAAAPGATVALLAALPRQLDLKAASVETGRPDLPGLTGLVIGLRRDPRTGGDLLMPAFSIESTAGVSRLDAEGRIGPRGGGLGFDGAVTLQARSAAGLIAGFNDGEAPDTATGRFGRVALRARAALAPQGLNLADLSGTVDGADVAGGLSAAWGGPDGAWRLGGRLAFDRLNLDAYLPVRTGADDGAESVQAGRLVVAGLPDAGGGRVQLAAGQGVWRGGTVQDLEVDLSIEGSVARGVVRFRDDTAARFVPQPAGAS